MAELKTKPTGASVDDFLDAIENDQVRQDCRTIVEMMQNATNAKAEMWGSSIVGFGHFNLVYPNGRKLDWMQIGFSPRKQNITLYVFGGFEEYDGLVGSLGKCSRGKGCIYIKRLSEINQQNLNILFHASVIHVLEKYSE